MAKGKKTVCDEISEVHQERAATLANLRTKHAMASMEKKSADAKATEAINSENADAYTKAKDASRKAADKIEFYNIQIKNAEAAPLFDNPAERKAKADEIKKGYEELKADKMKTAALLLKEALTVIEDVQKEIKNDNAALEILAKNTGNNADKIDPFTIQGLWQRINSAMDHADIKPYI